MDIFSDKNTLELLTVAAEYCGFIEKSDKFSKKDFIGKLQKILSLVYLKTSLIAGDTLEDFEGETLAFLSEYEYEYIKRKVSEKLSSSDSYIGVFQGINADDEIEQVEISTCITDVYHNLKNFVENFRTFSEENALASRAELISDFKEYWGYRLLSALQALHYLLYFVDLKDDDEESDDDELPEEENTSQKSFYGSFVENYHKKI
ncbi:MAG: DUF5063 domain-containing protein [Bacteroidales bacterium]|nr:DUF5063 domain-containing protein [Bacteroidales bacterium]